MGYAQTNGKGVREGLHVNGAAIGRIVCPSKNGAGGQGRCVDSDKKRTGGFHGSGKQHMRSA